MAFFCYGSIRGELLEFLARYPPSWGALHSVVHVVTSRPCPVSPLAPALEG